MWSGYTVIPDNLVYQAAAKVKLDNFKRPNDSSNKAEIVEFLFGDQFTKELEVRCMYALLISKTRISMPSM